MGLLLVESSIRKAFQAFSEKDNEAPIENANHHYLSVSVKKLMESIFLELLRKSFEINTHDRFKFLNFYYTFFTNFLVFAEIV